MSVKLRLMAKRLYEPNKLQPNLFALLQLAEFLETLKPSQFSNASYRSSQKGAKSVQVPKGQKADCVGWAVHLENEDVLDNFRFPDGAIDFSAYSQGRFGLDVLSEDWEWNFSYKWKNVCDAPSSASERIRYYIKNGVPKNWLKVVNGIDEPPFKVAPKQKIFKLTR
jgi:hypothetical protein